MFVNETTLEVNSKDKLNYSTRKSRVNGLNIDTLHHGFEPNIIFLR